MELSGLGFGSTFGSFGGFGNAAQSGGTGWLDVLNTAIGGVGNIIASRNASRSGSGFVQLPAGVSSVLANGAGGLLGSLLGGSPSGVMTSSTPGIFSGGPLDAFRPDFYVSGGSSVRARRLIPVQSPRGEISYWRHVGRPVAFSGDQGHCRRLAKVARKLGGGARCGGTKRRRR
jgi:hypothetical protein